LLLAAAALVLLAPRFVDTPAVRAEIQRRLAHALGAQVSWEALDIALLPPRGELRKVRIEIPGRLGAAAEQLDVYLRPWPLLLGHPEISSVTLSRPSVRIVTQAGGETPDPLALYRAALEPAVRALREYAPDMTLRIEEAAVDVGDLRLQKLTLRATTGATGVELKGAAASNFWRQLSLDARIEYADLSARAALTIEEPTLRAKLATDGKQVIEAQLDDVDLAQALALAESHGARLEAIESAEGRLSVNAELSRQGLEARITRSSAALKLAQLPWKLSARAGHLSVTPMQVRVTGASGSLGESTFENAAAQIELGAPARLASASGNARLALEQWLPWLKTKAPLEEISAASGTLEVALRHAALRFDRPAEMDFEALATPRKVSATLKMLPAAVTADGGSVRAGPRSIVLEKLPVAMLDSRADVSGSISLKDAALELSLEQGIAGEKLVRWALERGAVAARFEPRTPLRFAAPRVAWAPKRALEANARVDFEGGPALALAVAWRPPRLELRRVALKDARSDAVLGASIAGERIEASFSGRLHGQSIPAMLRHPPRADSGLAQGELRLTIDRVQPERTSAEGSLRIEALDLGWLAGRKAIIERAEIVAEQHALRIAAARFGWEDQFFELRGTARRTQGGPVIEARVESQGVALERLLPAPDPGAPPADESALWPLPVSGRIELHAGFVQFQRHRIEPLDGVLYLEPRRARLEVKEARACGLSFPLELEAAPDDVSLAVRLSMRDAPFEQSMHCLTGGTVAVSGNADLRAELKTRGRRPDLVRNLTGTVEAEVRDGHMKRFAAINNILAFRGIAKPDAAKETGLPYRRMSARGYFERGEFVLDEGFFDSSVARLAASGRIDLQGAGTRLTVLVAPLTAVERVVGAVPLLGDVFGGTMLALPVAVNGDIRDPTIVPLGPRAISDQLLGIFERTLKLPGKLAVPAPQEPKP
jgi:hypothetical protein